MVNVKYSSILPYIYAGRKGHTESKAIHLKSSSEKKKKSRFFRGEEDR